MKTKKQVNLYPFYALKDMSEHLKVMAGKGWHIRRAGAIFWEYEKDQPKDLRYSVCWSGEAEAYTPKQGDQRTFRAQAEEKGWHPAVISDQLQIYAAEAPEPEQIHASPYDRLMGIQQAAKPYMFLYGTIIFLGILSLLLLLFKMRIMPVAALAGGFTLMMPFVLLGLSCHALLTMIVYFCYKNRAEISATKGEYAENTVPLKETLVWVLGISAVILGLAAVSSGIPPMFGVFFAFLVGIVALLIVLKAIRNSVQSKNRIFTVILDIFLAVFLVGGVTLAVTKINQADAGYNRDLPVTAQQLGLVQENTELQNYMKTRSSALLRYTEASQIQQNEDGTYMPVLSYEMVEGRAIPVDGMVLDHYLTRMASSATKDENGEIQSVKYKAIDEKPWGAKKAWQMTDGTVDFNVYLLLFDDILVELGVPEPLTEEKMALFGSGF